MRLYLSAVVLLLICAVAAPSSAFGAATTHRQHHARVSHPHAAHTRTRRVRVNRHHAVPTGQLEARQSVRRHRATARRGYVHRSQTRHLRVQHATRHARGRHVAYHRRYVRHSRYERIRLERIRRERIEREHARLDRTRLDRERRDRTTDETARLDHRRLETASPGVAETVASDTATANGTDAANLAAAGSSEAEIAADFEHTPAPGTYHLTEVQEAELAEYIPPIPMRDGRLYVPPPMRGSLASLLRQNRRDEAEGLHRIQNLTQLAAMHRDGQLVSLPLSEALTANPQLPYDRRCARPWTVTFLANLAHAHFVRFHRPLQVTSAVRPVSYQRRLVHFNGNAAPAYGDTSSPHERGATIDIGKKGMTLSEIAWMRAYLLPLQQEGKIDVEEEFYQACFHITVYESYIPPVRREHNSTLLAAGIP